MGQRICIDAGSRWDAVALLEELHGFHRHLVQLDRARFELYLYTEGDDRTLADDLRQRLEDWLDERRLGQTTVRFPDGTTREIAPAARR